MTKQKDELDTIIKEVENLRKEVEGRTPSRQFTRGDEIEKPTSHQIKDLCPLAIYVRF